MVQAKKTAKAPVDAALQKLIKSETDTVRAAHFQRMADGPDALTHLTFKDDRKRGIREKLIRSLPPIVPIIEQHGGPSEPTTNDVAALQAQVKELQAQLAERAA